MSVDFASVTNITIPEGEVVKISDTNGTTLWKKYEVDSLATCSWAEISEISKAGGAAGMFSIGDVKNISVNGVSYSAHIIGFDHDTPVDISAYGREKVGITFQLVDCLSTKYQMENNRNRSNNWSDSSMRTSVMSNIFNNLTSDLQNVIVTVGKTSAIDSDGTVVATRDNCFLLSEFEVWGRNKWSTNTPLEAQYDFYVNGNSKIKSIDGTASPWLLRSKDFYLSHVVTVGYNKYCSVNKTGNYGYSRGNVKGGVSFCFCV